MYSKSLYFERVIKSIVKECFEGMGNTKEDYSGCIGCDRRHLDPKKENDIETWGCHSCIKNFNSRPSDNEIEKMIDAFLPELRKKISEWSWAEKPCFQTAYDRYEIHQVPFNERLDTIEDNSVDLIFADVPNNEDTLQALDIIYKAAESKLRELGSLVITAPIIPKIFSIYCRHPMELSHHWTFPFITKESGFCSPQWKPAYWFAKCGGEKNEQAILGEITPQIISDICRGYNKEDGYSDQLSQIIKHFSMNEQLVVDLYMNEGEFGKLALEAGRRFVGFEDDAYLFKMAEREIHNAAIEWTDLAFSEWIGREYRCYRKEMSDEEIDRLLID